MSTLLVSAAAALAVLLLLIAAASTARRNPRQTTYICAECLYACSSHDAAVLHMAAVHPRKGIA